MIEKFIAIYVFIDDIMIEIGHKEPINRNSSDSELIVDLFLNTADIIKRLNISSEYIIDSFPVATCENIRICRSKRIHAVTIDGFLMKVILFIFVFTINEKFL